MSQPTDGTAALQNTDDVPAGKLIGLAVLKANWNDGKSYLDNFVPFVVECLRGPRPLGVRQTQTALRRDFSLKIPQSIVKTLILRACKVGEVEPAETAGTYRASPGASLRPTSPKQQEFLRCHKAVVDGLREFALATFNRDLTVLAATSALDSYVDDFGLPIVTRGAAADLEFTPDVVDDPDTSYIVHRFVSDLADADPAGFAYLTTVVEGSMLRCVVYLPDPGARARRFKGTTTVYLDTPFLLRLLGHHGSELEAPAVELAELLRDTGASLACFDKTLAELRGVLLTAAREVRRRLPRAGEDVLTHFVARGMGPADINIAAARLEKDMAHFGIRILAAPPYDDRSSVDETVLEEVLNEEVGYRSQTTLLHDLDALTAIDRLRDGQAQPILENSRAIFLTTNDKLVRAARRYWTSDQGFAWPPAILDTELATLVWLKMPMKAPDLPRKQIMADCYATLRPSDAVWNRWLDEIERTAAAGTYTDDQLEYLRRSPDAQLILMDVTLGDPTAVTHGTVDEVAAAARDAFTRPIAEELAATKSQLASVTEKLADERTQREAGEAETENERIARLAAEETLERGRESRCARISRRAHHNAARWARAAAWTLHSIVFLAASLTVLPLTPLPGPNMPQVVDTASWLIAAVGIAIGALGDSFGLNVRQIGGYVERGLEPRLKLRYLRQAGEDEHDAA